MNILNELMLADAIYAAAAIYLICLWKAME